MSQSLKVLAGKLGWYARLTRAAAIFLFAFYACPFFCFLALLSFEVDVFFLVLSF